MEYNKRQCFKSLDEIYQETVSQPKLLLFKYHLMTYDTDTMWTLGIMANKFPQVRGLPNIPKYKRLLELRANLAANHPDLIDKYRDFIVDYDPSASSISEYEVGPNIPPETHTISSIFTFAPGRTLPEYIKSSGVVDFHHFPGDFSMTPPEDHPNYPKFDIVKSMGTIPVRETLAPVNLINSQKILVLYINAHGILRSSKKRETLGNLVPLLHGIHNVYTKDANIMRVLDKYIREKKIMRVLDKYIRDHIVVHDYTPQASLGVHNVSTNFIYDLNVVHDVLDKVHTQNTTCGMGYSIPQALQKTLHNLLTLPIINPGRSTYTHEATIGYKSAFNSSSILNMRGIGKTPVYDVYYRGESFYDAKRKNLKQIIEREWIVGRLGEFATNAKVLYENIIGRYDHVFGCLYANGLTAEEHITLQNIINDFRVKLHKEKTGMYLSSILHGLIESFPGFRIHIMDNACKGGTAVNEFYGNQQNMEKTLGMCRTPISMSHSPISKKTQKRIPYVNEANVANIVTLDESAISRLRRSQILADQQEKDNQEANAQELVDLVMDNERENYRIRKEREEREKSNKGGSRKFNKILRRKSKTRKLL